GGSLVYLSSPSGHAGDGSAELAATVDGRASTAWHVPDLGDGASWQLELVSPRALTEYILTSADAGPATDPRDVVLEASNDGHTWQTLDTRTGLAFAGRGEAQAFAFTNATAYTIYRLTFTGPGGLDLAGVALTGQGYDTRSQRVAIGYRRALETASGVHYTRFSSITGTVLREALASREEDLIVLRYSSTSATDLSGDIGLTSAQDAPATADAQAARIGFSGTMAND